MARPLRINIEGGWYHITSRGQRRDKIFHDDRDRREFLTRLEEMTKRHGVEVHGYVLLPNHYHLLIRTPKANASEAIQWMNNGYGMWWNRRHRQAGHVFQGRFKGVLVEGAGWLLGLSMYVHFNPVAVKGLGWGKKEKREEGLGWTKPSADEVKARLETVRAYVWSSYRAYAGYEAVPGWLSTAEILGRVKGGRQGYRKEAEGRLRQGEREDIWSKVRWGVVLGSEKFAEKVRRGMLVVRETHGRGALRKEVGWREVVAAVERVKRKPWKQFADQYGDWGRDLALWVGRRRAGMKLKELGVAAGGMDYSAVSEAIRHFERKSANLPVVHAARRQVLTFLNLET